MDTFILNAITQELRPQICPARLNNFWQTDDHSLVIGLWRQGQELRLALSVAPQHQYLFLTSQRPENQTLAFGKFLLQHIKGGELRAIRKPLLERILTFEIVKKDIDGQDLKFQLILEIMGRYSNLILVNQDTQKILESIRHVTAAQSSYRRIAPGAVYAPPPEQDKVDPATLEREGFQHMLRDYAEELRATAKLPFEKFLLQRVKGFSPLIAREIAGSDTDADAEARWQRFARIVEILKTGNYQPAFVLAQDAQGVPKPAALSAVMLQTKACAPAASMNQALESYYQTIVAQGHTESLRTALLSSLNARLAKLQKKQAHLAEQQAQIDSAEQYKRNGELITANLYQLKKGMATANVIDYYAETQPEIEITLDPRYTPAQNAQRYFKRYAKLKQGKDITLQRLQDTEQALAYLEELKFFIEAAESHERLQALRDEWQGSAPPRRKKKGGQAEAPPEPTRPFWRFVSSDGFEIYVGRSSKENDLLTQNTALPDDLWLHVQQAPGSHVLILNRNRNLPVPERTLTEAAALAAYYSKLRNSGKVDVSYTLRKYVKKPKGSPPGLVTLAQFQTIRVVPRAEISK